MATRKKPPRRRRPSLARAGVTEKKTRRQIKRNIRAGKPAGLAAAGIQSQARRRRIRSRVQEQTTRRSQIRRRETRAAERQREERRRIRRVRRILPIGVRGSRRTAG